MWNTNFDISCCLFASLEKDPFAHLFIVIEFFFKQLANFNFAQAQLAAPFSN